MFVFTELWTEGSPGKRYRFKGPSCLVLSALYKSELQSQFLLLIQVPFSAFTLFFSQELVITEHHLCVVTVCNYV